MIELLAGIKTSMDLVYKLKEASEEKKVTEVEVLLEHLSIELEEYKTKLSGYVLDVAQTKTENSALKKIVLKTEFSIDHI